jgi:hypothetical protein
MNAFNNSFFVDNQGANVHGHPYFLSLLFHNYGRTLEGPPSMMSIPIPTFHTTFISSMHSINMFLMRTLVPNHSRLVNALMIHLFMNLLQGIQSSLITIGSSIFPSVLSFLNHTLLGC